jgi:hypothetical protein
LIVSRVTCSLGIKPWGYSHNLPACFRADLLGHVAHVDDARGDARGSAEATEGFSAEGIALIAVRFRSANEQIEEKAFALGADGQVPFLCECADPECTEVVLLSLREYERVRNEPTHFLNVPSHVAAAQGFADVVETREGYTIVEKTGAAAKAVLAQTREADEREGAT